MTEIINIHAKKITQWIESKDRCVSISDDKTEIQLIIAVPTDQPYAESELITLCKIPCKVLEWMPYLGDD